MIKPKKLVYLVIGVLALVLMLGTVTYAFFNYTRTGLANNIRTGTISFNSIQSSGQSTNINLTNIFPIDISNGLPENDPNVGEVNLHVTGDTTYGEGIEYLLKVVSVNNTAGTKSLPISIDVSYTATTNKTIGTEDEEYFDKRGENILYYKILAK